LQSIGCHQVNDSWLEQMARWAPNVVSLDLSASSITDSGLDKVEGPMILRHFTLPPRDSNPL
jgi:hypothetical protein